MRIFISILSLTFIALACQPPVDNSASEAFEKNSATVQAYLDAWQTENVDYDQFFTEDAMVRPTAVGTPDTVLMADMKSSDIRNWSALDFEIPKDIVFLPGVKPETKEMDGSVRYYGNWKVIIPESDSTERTEIVMKLYQSFDFNEDGKIWFMQSYGDWGGMLDIYEDVMEGEEEEDSMEDTEMEEDTVEM